MYKKVKAILHMFAVSTIPSAPIYKKLLHSPIRSSVRYFAALMGALIVILTAAIYFLIIPPAAIQQLRTYGITTLRSFPKNCQIKIENGILSTNLNRPLYVWGTSLGQPTLLLSVHEYNNSTIDTGSHAIIALGKNTITLQFKNLIFTRPYDGRMYVINSETVSRFTRIVETYANRVQIAFYVFYFLLFPVGIALWVSLLIFMSSLFTFIVFHAIIKRVHLARCIQATMHGSMIPFMIGFGLMVVYPTTLSAFLITPFLMFIFSLVATFEMYFEE
jgi:hypothetical protein